MPPEVFDRLPEGRVDADGGRVERHVPARGALRVAQQLAEFACLVRVQRLEAAQDLVRDFRPGLFQQGHGLVRIEVRHDLGELLGRDLLEEVLPHGFLHQARHLALEEGRQQGEGVLPGLAVHVLEQVRQRLRGLLAEHPRQIVPGLLAHQLDHRLGEQTRVLVHSARCSRLGSLSGGPPARGRSDGSGEAGTVSSYRDRARAHRRRRAEAEFPRKGFATRTPNA